MAFRPSCLPSGIALTLPEDPSCYQLPAFAAPILYTFLPTVVKSRLPVLSSLRRSTKMAASNISTPTHSRIPSEASSHGCTTPTNAYLTPNHELMTREQPQQGSRWPCDTHAHFMNTSPSPSVASSQTPATAPVDRALACARNETRSGVEWDTAGTAFVLLSEACRKAQQPDSKPENMRKLIIQANVWLLRSLPPELAPRELETIEEVLPVGLYDHGQFVHEGASRPRLSRRRPAKRSWLRRLIASFILQISILLALVVPYLSALANSCYQLERRHHITERVLTGGIDMTNLVGERGMELKDAAVRLGQSRVTDVILRTGCWVMESFIGGVCDGAEEGAVMVGEAIKSRQEQQTPMKHDE